MTHPADTRAAVPTEHGAKYIAQLCKHWSHKLEVEEAPGRARIVMPSGAVVTLAAGEAGLDVAIAASGPETLAQTKDVVASHLDRFAFREAPLAFDWADGAAVKNTVS